MRLSPPIAKDKIVRITRHFDPFGTDGTGLPPHFGLDLSCLEGTPIYAACDGVAYRASQPGGFGLYVRIEAVIDGVAWHIYTAHLRNWAVADGARVRAGDVIGYSGDTGNSSGPHLHFEVRRGMPGQPRPTSVQGAVDPEPMIDWGEPAAEARTMLTTLHVQRYQGWQNAFLRDIGAQWAKIVNPDLDTDLFPDVPNVDARFWDDNVAPGYIARGREGGHAYVRDNLPRWRRVRGRRIVFELPNEPECNTNEGLANLCQFTLGAIEEANAQGVTLVILNLAEANPHDNDTHNEAVVAWKWNELKPCIDAAIRGGHYLGRHCYWRPDVEGPTGRWHALGRLEADLAMLKDLGVDVDNLKALVNEWGIDGGIANRTPIQGWKVLTDAGTYRAQIIEGETYARKIKQIHGMMLFTSGYEGEWESYEHDVGFCGSLIGPLNSLIPDAIPEIPPEGLPMPTTELLAPLRRADVVRVTQRFTPPSHYGIDFSCYEGMPIFASCDGIAYRGQQASGFGLYVRIEDGAGLYVYAAHLRAWAVADGAEVQTGDVIGYSGNTGNSTGPHLHYEVRRAAPGAPRPTSAQGAIDPEPMLWWPEDVAPEQPEPLPNDEQGAPAVLATKARWWAEEEERVRGDDAVRADSIHSSLIALLYRIEDALT
jgi:murein DD-endopeptidase MepM/ murein hydrolase activator NlpD